MQRVLKEDQFNLTVNTHFEQVLNECGAIKRKGQEGTWITKDMKLAYLELHHRGFAKSYEVWEDNKLVGGLYGIDLGHVFCGESMFSKTTNASKYAFIRLTQQLLEKQYKLIDCQLHTRHLESLGAEEIPRKDFIKILKTG